MHDLFMKLVKRVMPNLKAGNGKDKAKMIGIDYLHDDTSHRLVQKRRAMNQISIDMQNGIKEEMSAFLTHTSFTALTQIYKANSVWRRLLWTILVIAMFAWLVVQCYWLLDKYYKYPMEVKLDLKAATALDFPSVTVCNLNPIKEEKVNHEPYTPLMKYISPDTHDFMFDEIIQSWLSDDNEEQGFHDDRQPNSRNPSNAPVTPSVRTTRPKFFQMHSNSTTSNETESAGVRNETMHHHHHVTEGYEMQPHNEHHHHNGSTPDESPQSEPEPDNVIGYIRWLWQRMKDTMTKEEFINMLHNDYLTHQQSGGSAGKEATPAGNAPTEVHSEGGQRKKRAVWPSPSNHPSNMWLGVKWEFLFQNSTFNKWNMLNSTMPPRFYEQRDDEYEAAMTYAYITAKLDARFVERSGHQKEDFIAACDFNGYQCSPENFTYLHSHKFGNCYTFNSKWANLSLETRFPGPERGLRLQLFLDQDNYVANLATEAGVKIMVHKKGLIPFPEDEGISVLAGRSTSIGMRQVVYSRLPPPHGECGNEGGTTDYYRANYGTDYSKLSCLKSCYQDLSVKFCNCSLPFYYVLDATRVCDMTERYTERCVTNMQETSKKSYEMCDKKCPQPCEEIKYDLFVSSAKWPSDKYQPFLNLQLHQSNWKYRNIQQSDKQFTKLQIYFQDLIYSHLEQQKSYESMNLISDLGGQLGLWLGLSAITIGELCSCLFGVGRLLPLKCRGNKPTQSQVKITPLTSMKPATLEEMSQGMCPAAAKYIPPYYVTTSVPAYTNV